MNSRNLLVTALIILCLSLAYYFLIVLPANNKAKLEIEQAQVNFQRNKAEAMFNCQRELAQKKDNGELSVQGLRNIDDVNKFTNMIIDNCMRSKGFDR